MIELEKVMNLIQPFISAASGLVELDGKFFIISDDENFVGIYDRTTLLGSASIVFDEILPADKALRKKMKRDIEALVFLPALKKLLLIPSGSTPRREFGALLNHAGLVEKQISFHALYSELGKNFSELNIEGGVVVDDELFLFQRGNGSKKQNGMIIVNLMAFLADKELKPKIISVDLGSVKNVALSFTDVTRINNSILFLAVAEDSDSTYFDGKITGSVLGLLNKEGEVICVSPLNTSSKPEGIFYSTAEKCFYLVTDDDNNQLPSSLFKGFLPDEWKIHVNMG